MTAHRPALVAGHAGDESRGPDDAGALELVDPLEPPARRLPRNAYLGTDGLMRRCRFPSPGDTWVSHDDAQPCRRCGRPLGFVDGTNRTSTVGAYWRHLPRRRRPSGAVR